MRYVMNNAMLSVHFDFVTAKSDLFAADLAVIHLDNSTLKAALYV